MNSITTLAILAVMPLCATQASGQSTFSEAEIKWTVPEALIPHAIEVLGLKKEEAKKEAVWFFDTAAQSLKQQHYLVLRAKTDDKGTESTVKLRVKDPASITATADSPGKVEWDVGETVKSLSQSVDAKDLKKGLLEQVIQGGSAEVLFPEEGQKRLLVPDAMDWAKIKRYGPVAAEVWKNKKDKPKKVQMPGYDLVTAELWHLEKSGSNKNILELSFRDRGHN